MPFPNYENKVVDYVNLDVPYIHQITNTSIELKNRGSIKPKKATENLDPDYDPTEYDPEDTPPSEQPEIQETKQYIRGNSQCGISCMSMLINFWLKKKNKPLIKKADIVSLYNQYDTNYINGISSSSQFENSYYLINTVAKQVFTSKGLNISLFNFEHLTNRPNTELKNVITTIQVPVMVSTKLTGKGHYIVIKGYQSNRVFAPRSGYSNQNNYIVNDPFFTYDFYKKKYVNPPGEGKLYPETDLLGYIGRSSLSNGNAGIRLVYIKEK